MRKSTAYGNTKEYTMLENTLKVPSKVKHWVPIWPSHTFPRFIPPNKKKKKRKYVYPRTCTWMFITVLFLIVKKLKWTRWQNSNWTYSTFLSMDTSGIHLQTQMCLQKTNWKLRGVPAQRKRLYTTTNLCRMKELGKKRKC